MYKGAKRDRRILHESVRRRPYPCHDRLASSFRSKNASVPLSSLSSSGHKKLRGHRKPRRWSLMSNATKRNGNAVFSGLMMLLLSAPAAQCQSPQPQLALRRVIGIEYPWFARMSVLQGDVDLIATISTQGTVTKVQISSGPEPLSLA